MKVLFVANVFYSVQIDFACGRSITKFFTHLNPLKSRSSALTYYLSEACLSDDYAQDEIYAMVNVHCLKTNERFELTNSMAWQNGHQIYTGLESECQLYLKQNVRFSGYALYNPSKPHLVTLISRNYENIQRLKIDDAVITLAEDYSIFFKRKKEKHLIA